MQTMYAVRGTGGPRLSTRHSTAAVAFNGVHRVRAIESLLPHSDSLRVWGDDETGISGWEVSNATSQFPARTSVTTSDSATMATPAPVAGTASIKAHSIDAPPAANRIRHNELANQGSEFRR